LNALSVHTSNALRGVWQRRVKHPCPLGEPTMASKNIQLQLLPEEREILLKWIFIPEVRSQLEAFVSSAQVATITVTPTDVNWLASDLTHAIVKKGCRDSVAIDLSERLEFVAQSRDGRLESWYG
jgi:hypothetical protein